MFKIRYINMQTLTQRDFAIWNVLLIFQMTSQNLNFPTNCLFPPVGNVTVVKTYGVYYHFKTIFYTAIVLYIHMSTWEICNTEQVLCITAAFTTEVYLKA